MGYINNRLHSAQKYAQILVRGHYMFQETKSLKTVIFEEQVMFKDKHSTIFASNGGYWRMLQKD